MRHFRKIPASVLLAVYATISLLGQGLHFLTADDGHHHHHASAVAACHSHEHDHQAGCDHHEHYRADEGGSADLIAADHDCGICEFLAQAKSPAPQFAAPLDFQAVVSELRIHAPTFDTPIIIGLHAARGPPLLLA